MDKKTTPTNVVTKAERLQQLKDQESFYKVLDKYFDAGWRDFVKEIHRKNDVSNIRMFKLLSAINGNDFVADLIKLMGRQNKSALIKLTKKPKGILLKDSRFKNIPELMVNKYPSGSYKEGEIFIQVHPDRWITFVY
jgi:hypothetical protein